MISIVRAKHTSGMGKEHEEFVAKTFEWANAKRSRSSGASFHDPVDVTCDVAVIECEATEAKSYSLKESFWEEVVEKQHTGKLPMLAIRYRHTTDDKHTDLGLVDLEMLSALLAEVEEYREDALRRG